MDKKHKSILKVVHITNVYYIFQANPYDFLTDLCEKESII